ncbi:hypothetical protein SAMN04489707_102517 [Paenacidovorax caeni]|uniref:FHA domain-containing protein n=2 Tax=Paenacidovorax caeni TaxID=343013 RepID=A0A1I7JE24_9BURK|nr:hypothetical protein SAMN04489707_102517 [Paenacidovorax caeni]
MMNFAHTPAKTWPQRFMDWTFGAPQPLNRPSDDVLRGKPGGMGRDSAHEILPPPEPDTVPVWVEQKARSALEAFKDAITDGTRLFCEQHVHPLYMLDQSTKYRVTGIQVFVPREKSSFLQPLEKLPIEVRNRMARILVMAAPGAQEQLVIDDGFFGISLDVEPTVIDGQTIRLIASWSIDSAEIKFLFSGQYISVVPKPTQSVVEVVPQKEPCTSDPAIAQTVVDVESSASCSEAKPNSAAASVEPVMTTPVTPRRVGNETPLSLPHQTMVHGTDTPLAKPTSRQIAFVRVQYAGQDQEATIAITQDMLPFVIGREHTSTGRFQHGLSLGNPRDANLGLLVSREHLELSRFDPETSTFYLVNHGHPRNGSFHQGSALSERFMLKAMAPGNVIHLGGCGGVGTVRIIIEAV